VVFFGAFFHYLAFPFEFRYLSEHSDETIASQVFATLGHRQWYVVDMRLKTLINICFLTLFSFGPTVQGRVAPANAVGRVVTVKGDVSVRGQQLKAGDYVFLQDVIETKTESSAKLFLNDRTIVDISPSSSFRLNEFKLNDVADRVVDGTVAYGEVRSLVSKKLNQKGRFNFRTRASVLAVRGTEFFVTATDRTDKILVTEGKVWVDSLGKGTKGGREAILTPGQQWNSRVSGRVDSATLANAERQTEVISLPRRDLASFSTNHRVRDNTFTKSVTFTDEPASKTEEAKPATKENPDRRGTSTKAEEKKAAASDTGVLGTIQQTVDQTVLADKKITPSVDSSVVSVPGLNRNPTLPPVNGNDQTGQMINIKVKVN